jgi:hypothetical protein
MSRSHIRSQVALAGLASALLAILTLAPALTAQVTGDSRTVTEPKFPTVCTTLLAEQVAGSLNESAPDTTRVQSA